MTGLNTQLQSCTYCMTCNGAFQVGLNRPIRLWFL